MTVVNGDVEKGSFMSGQVAAMVNDERTTKEILEFLMYDLKLETEVLKRRLENWDILKKFFFNICNILYTMLYFFRVSNKK